MKRIITNSISAKIIILFVSTNIFISVIAAYSAINSMQILKKNSVEESRYNLDLAINQIDNDLTYAQKFIYTFTSTDADFVTMNSNYSGDRYYISSAVIRDEMKIQLSSYRYVSGMFVYVPERNDLLTVTQNNSLGEFIWITKYITQNAVNERQKIWHIISVNNRPYIFWVKKYDKAYVGAFGKVDSIIKDLNVLGNYSDGVVCFTEVRKAENKDGFIMVSSASKANDIQITGYIPKEELYGNIPYAIKINMGLAIAGLLAVPLLVICLKSWLIVPLVKIKAAMEEIKYGNMDFKIVTSRTSYEFNEINETFNKMTSEIKALKIENYEKKLEKQKADFQILQLKINPHFLLNSFNIIYSMAQTKDFKAVQNLSMYLANYFRYIFHNGNELVELSKEIDFIKDYLAISAIRFPDSFCVSYEIEEQLKDLKILPLLIQNFVENVIKYGIILGKCIDIFIKAYEQESEIVLSVIDTGKGMEQDCIDRIMSDEISFNKKSTGTGIMNCRKRLYYLYGAQAQIHIRSKLNEGTEIMILIPKEKEDKSGREGFRSP
ncbi:sensor histidine kinase [Anaerocolumna jejuensis]|uniref:sensor histidine kinase n=1 Tax=Anaerocolumna jejuensis TaxID=259063 RepID=UPI003F7B741D